jgi:superfamily II DNA/RNA helicase
MAAFLARIIWFLGTYVFTATLVNGFALPWPSPYRAHISKPWRETAQFSSENSDSTVNGQFFYSKKSFEEVGANMDVMGGLFRAFSMTRPSRIQAISYQDLYDGETSILADQTGSGKTFAYLLPLLQRLLELQRNGTIPQAPSRSPYLVVLTPTTELAEQVGAVARAVSNLLKFRSSVVTSNSNMDSEQRKLRLGVDLLVCTPGRLLALLNRKELDLLNLQSIVLDEADVLFLDQSFPLPPIGAACPTHSQVHFCSTASILFFSFFFFFFFFFSSTAFLYLHDTHLKYNPTTTTTPPPQSS